MKADDPAAFCKQLIDFLHMKYFRGKDQMSIDERADYEKFLKNEQIVEMERLDVIERHMARRTPMQYFRQSRVEMEGWQDDLNDEFIAHMRTWLAAKKTSKTVTFRETVSLSFAAPDGWFQHLMHDHPWIATLLRTKPRYRITEKEKTVTDSKTVEFAAVIPELEIPEHILRDGKKTFEVYHTVL